MDEEHVENRKLDDRLVRTRSDSVQSTREIPLCSAVELSLPNHRPKDEEGRDQEDRPPTDLHRKRDPEDVGKALSLS